MDIGKEMRRKRNTVGLSVEEVAAKVGVPSEDIYQLEIGRTKRLDFHLLGRLALLYEELDTRPVTFGLRLRTVREEKGLCQTTTSKKLGLSRSALSMYERDERQPEFSKLIEIADFYGVSVDYLLGRTEVREVNRG